eukprot:SAG11_NODE_580_length_8367_cov_3.375060_4_plen_96_part_00
MSNEGKDLFDAKQHALLQKVNLELLEFFVNTRRYVANCNEETYWKGNANTKCSCEYGYFLDDDRCLKYMYRDEHCGPGWNCKYREGACGFVLQFI